MWFVLGLVSLVVFFGYRLFRKLYWAWGWTDDHGHQKHNGEPYKTRHTSHKETHWFRFAVVCPPEFHFRIKRETMWDRFAKRIRLSVEQQLKDPEFDESFYLVSDDPALAGELAQLDELRQVIKALFRDPNMHTLVCEGRHLVAELKTSGPLAPAEYDGGDRGRLIVSALQELARVLAWVTEVHGAKRRDFYALRAALLVSVASAMLALGFVELFRLFQFERGDVMLDAADMLGFSALVAAVVLFFLLGATATLLRGSSHAHIVMWEVLISGGLGLLMSGYALARDINTEWDDQVATPVVVEVTRKHQGYRRKRGTYYQIYFTPVDGGARLPGRLEVPRSVYALAVEGEQLVVHVKPGYLGYRWIGAISRP
jgi:hypothetical protein